MATASPKPRTGTFHDALTGETIIRELTAEEIQALEEPIQDETPTAD
jgi:hypothetical protein